MHKKCTCAKLKSENSEYRNCCCENCGFDLKLNKIKQDYCPNCGQYTYDIFVKKYAFWGRGLEDVFDIKHDRWQWREILRNTIMHPHKLIQQYWDGKRKKVGSPFRLYMLITFAFFLFIPITEHLLIKDEKLNAPQKVSMTEHHEKTIEYWRSPKKKYLNADEDGDGIKDNENVFTEKNKPFFYNLSPTEYFIQKQNRFGKNIKNGIESAEKKGYTRNQIIYSSLYFFIGIFIFIGAGIFQLISIFTPEKHTYNKSLVTSIYFVCSVLITYLITYLINAVLLINNCYILQKKYDNVEWYMWIFAGLSMIQLMRILVDNYLIKSTWIAKLKLRNKAPILYILLLAPIVFMLQFFDWAIKSAEYIGYFWEGL